MEASVRSFCLSCGCQLCLKMLGLDSIGRPDKPDIYDVSDMD